MGNRFGEGPEYVYFWERLRQVVREEIAAALSLKPEQPVEEREEWISMKELCDRLQVSKQTLYNWQKSDQVNWLIKPCRKRMGGKVLYNVEGLKQAIKQHPHLFGGGRDYAFKEAVLQTAEQKRALRYSRISSALALRPGEVSADERLWHGAEEARQAAEREALLFDKLSRG